MPSGPALAHRSAKLPDDATDTGFRLEGRQLWLAESPGAACFLSLRDPGDVLRWPRAAEPITCA